jgi:SAM-dependent methyltransferase
MGGEAMKENWEAGKSHEVEFWRKWIRYQADEFNLQRPLRRYFRPLIGEKLGVDIADLGSGAIPLIGSYVPEPVSDPPGEWGVGVRVRASDILAKEYAELWEQAKIVPFAPVEYQDMEELTYLDNQYDIVHCSNALDHCCSPARAIKEMIRICKPGGWIYLRHFRNVGVLEKYSGLHQWNIMANDDHDAIFWNRETRFHLSSIAPGFRTERKEDDLIGYPFIVSVMQKV